MKINLTNEQLELFFDDRLKGDIISDGVDTYKLTNPILHIMDYIKMKSNAKYRKNPLEPALIKRFY